MKKGLVVLSLVVACLVGSQLKAQDGSRSFTQDSNEELNNTEMSVLDYEIEEEYWGAMNLIDDELREEKRENIKRGGRGERGNAKRRGGDMLNLSDEQKAQMKQIRMDVMKNTKDYRDELRELKAKEITLTTAVNPSMKAINSNIKKMGEIMIELAMVKAEAHQQMRSLLTEEQRMSFDRMSSKRGDRGGRGHGKKGGMDKKDAPRS